MPRYIVDVPDYFDAGEDVDLLDSITDALSDAGIPCYIEPEELPIRYDYDND